MGNMKTDNSLTTQSSEPQTTFGSMSFQSQRLYLLLFMACYAVISAVFYPKMYTSLDESANFGMAYVLRHGTIYQDKVGYILSMSALGPFGHVYRFPIGFPACLAVISFLGSWAFFLVNPACHLVATWFFGKLLRRLHIPVMFAIFYLFYPGFVLYDRTLFSDGFAASLTTIALYFLCRRHTVIVAGVFLGLALLSRSTSLVVTVLLLLGAVAFDVSAYRTHKTLKLNQSRSLFLLLGIAPFYILNGLYNHYTTGHFFHSTYSADMLSVQNLRVLGPLYSASLLLIYPGMLLAPFFYRGRFWREGIGAATAVFLIAASYYETTYGDNKLQTLVSVTRQVLPAMPFFLLAYVSVLSKIIPQGRRLQAASWGLAGILLVMAGGISALHQKHLRSMLAMKAEIQQTLPSQAVIYGNKDIFKLHQPVWEPNVYRDVTTVSSSDIAEDTKKGPVYLVLYLRSRGIAHEDGLNSSILEKIQRDMALAPGPSSKSHLLTYYRIVASK